MSDTAPNTAPQAPAPATTPPAGAAVSVAPSTLAAASKKKLNHTAGIGGAIVGGLAGCLILHPIAGAVLGGAAGYGGSAVGSWFGKKKDEVEEKLDQ